MNTKIISGMPIINFVSQMIKLLLELYMQKTKKEDEKTNRNHISITQQG